MTSASSGNAARRPARPEPIEWLCLAGGLFLLLRYRWVMDDAFVYFRYVDNWVWLKLGLVFNQGEYVEGYTSPVWLLLLALLRAARADYWIAVQVVGCASFVVFWALLVRLDRSLSPEGPRANLPLAFLSFTYGTLCYFTSGLETPLVQVLAVVTALHLVDARRWHEPLLALSPLVRPELAVPLALVIAWSGLVCRRIPWRLVGWTAAFGTAWLAFRIVYYAELFPNTFHLKHTALPAQGLLYLWDTARAYRLLPVGVALLALFGLARGFAARPETLAGPKRAAMLVVASGAAAYLVGIGGDPRHYRYLAFSFCLAVCASAGLWEQLAAARALRHRRAVASVVGAAVAAFAFSGYPVQLDRHPVRFGGRAPTHTASNLINDAEWHRANPRLAPSVWAGSALAEAMRRARDGDAGFAYRGVEAQGYCVRAYVRFDRRVVQRWGLTDAVLARVDVPTLKPGHPHGLRRFAGDLVRIQAAAPEIGRGMYARAVAEGRAPAWVADNLPTLEAIERKIYHRHDALENLALAFSFPGDIDPGPASR